MYNENLPTRLCVSCDVEARRMRICLWRSLAASFTSRRLVGRASPTWRRYDQVYRASSQFHLYNLHALCTLCTAL